MGKSYESMIQAQTNFTDIAISRASQIAHKNNIDISKSQILGVSFTPEYAIVGVLYTPTIVGPGDNGEPRPANIPVPVECLFVHDESWVAIYDAKVAEANAAIQTTKDSGIIADIMNTKVN